MASTIKVDKLDPQSGTALEIGTSGDTVTVPSGVGLTLTDSTLLLPTTVTATTEVKTNKISPATGTAFALGDSGDTFTVPSGATIVNSGTATGFGGGKIGQVLSTTKTDTFSSASATWTDLTGMSVAITPSATSSKILILVTLGCFVSSSGDARAQGLLLRGTTSIAEGDAATGEECTWAFCGRTNAGTHHQFSACSSFLDAPSTTSATTYKLQVQRGPDAAGTVYVNQSGAQDANSGNTVSTITVMEVLV